MLKDPLTIVTLSSTGLNPAASRIDAGDTAQLAVFHIVDVQTGRTVRSGSTSNGTADMPLKLTISRSESKENKGQITDRIAIRLESRKTLESGNDATAQATLTLSKPRLGFTSADLKLIVMTLISSVIANGEDAAGSVTWDFDRFDRILAGEG